MALPFHTVGHSTRSIEQFLELLRAADVTFIVDIRSVPQSRTNPQYNKETLPACLASFQVGYEQIAQLGGLRGKSKLAQPDMNGFWENRSFHNYADYALTESFRARCRVNGKLHRKIPANHVATHDIRRPPVTPTVTTRR